MKPCPFYLSLLPSVSLFSTVKRISNHHFTIRFETADLAKETPIKVRKTFFRLFLKYLDLFGEFYQYFYYCNLFHCSKNIYLFIMQRQRASIAICNNNNIIIIIVIDSLFSKCNSQIVSTLPKANCSIASKKVCTLRQRGRVKIYIGRLLVSIL